MVQARRGIEDSTKEEEEAVAKKAAEEEEEAAKKAERQRLFEDQLDLARRAKIREWDQGKEATLQADKEGDFLFHSLPASRSDCCVNE